METSFQENDGVFDLVRKSDNYINTTKFIRLKILNELQFHGPFGILWAEPCLFSSCWLAPPSIFNYSFHVRATVACTTLSVVPHSLLFKQNFQILFIF